MDASRLAYSKSTIRWTDAEYGWTRNIRETYQLRVFVSVQLPALVRPQLALALRLQVDQIDS